MQISYMYFILHFNRFIDKLLVSIEKKHSSFDYNLKKEIFNNDNDKCIRLFNRLQTDTYIL